MATDTQDAPFDYLPMAAQQVLTKRALVQDGKPFYFHQLLDDLAEMGATARDCAALFAAWRDLRLPTGDQPIRIITPGFVEEILEPWANLNAAFPGTQLIADWRVLEELLGIILKAGGEISEGEAGLLAAHLNGTIPVRNDARLQVHQLASDLREEAAWADDPDAESAMIRLAERIETQPAVYDFALERTVNMWRARKGGMTGLLAALNP